MAEGGDKVNTPRQAELEAIKRYNRLLKQAIDREAKLTRQWEWKGNKLPPFNIEPMQNERHRLAANEGKGMTAEERALRKQWIHDQALSPNEPRHVAELHPRNPIRKALALPWDGLFKALKPVVGENVAALGRFAVPKLFLSYLVICGAWYSVKYSPSTWQAQKGWHRFENRDQILPGDPRWPNVQKNHEEFFDKGFMNRQALLDCKTTRLP